MLPFGVSMQRQKIHTISDGVVTSWFIDYVAVTGGLLAIILGLAGLELARRAGAKLPGMHGGWPPFLVAANVSIGIGIFHVWNGLGGL